MDSKQTYSLPDSKDAEELFTLLGDVRELTAGSDGKADDGSTSTGFHYKQPNEEGRGMPTEDLASS